MAVVELQMMISDTGRLGDAESAATAVELQKIISDSGRLSLADSGVTAAELEMIISDRVSFPVSEMVTSCSTSVTTLSATLSFPESETIHRARLVGIESDRCQAPPHSTLYIIHFPESKVIISSSSAVTLLCASPAL